MTQRQALPIMPVMEDLNEQIRRAIEAAPGTRRDLCRASDVDEGLLSNFVHGKRQRLSLRTIEALADALGLEVVLRPKRKER